ncbi:MAG TPA: hypothetical protein VH206_19385 [Xanthobacteraceae bacterium]|jgi:hypothetical protein|nr:hypothetical protein [Xanthobacteraceae bacterium]
MDESRYLPMRFFSESAPESVDLGRQSDAQPSAQGSGSPVWASMTGSQLRLYAWSELPDRHRNEVCRQIRLRCEVFIGSLRVDRGQRKTEVDRLVSEVVAHLLRATSLPKNEIAKGETTKETELPAVRTMSQANAGRSSAQSSAVPPWLASGQADPLEPARDSRIAWMVEETCNRQALLHRYEDVRRRERGGKWDGSGYPLVAVDEQTIEQLSGHYDPAESDADPLQAEDTRRAWAGLMHLAEHQFGENDDVVSLVRVLAEDRETQDSFGTQWPIGRIVRALNAKPARIPWNDDRVENAKRRLTKFIHRFRQEHGLDAIDLRALLAGYARQRHVIAGRDVKTK